MILTMIDVHNLGSIGEFFLGAAAILGLLSGARAVKSIARMFRSRTALEKERLEAVHAKDVAFNEAEAARREAGSWKSEVMALERRLSDIEKRVVPKFTAALRFIKELVEYIGHLERAMGGAQVKIPIMARMPEAPAELTDDLDGI